MQWWLPTSVGSSLYDVGLPLASIINLLYYVIYSCDACAAKSLISIIGYFLYESLHSVNITIIVLNNLSSFCLLSHTMLYVNTEGKSTLASVVVSPAGTISRRFAPCAIILTCRCSLQPVTTVASLSVTAKCSSEFMQECPTLPPYFTNPVEGCRITTHV